ncbi:MAG: hypothetical protein EOP45_23580, partial [Sphingobacteriaceae bacterium]
MQITLSLLGLGIGLSTIDPKTEADPTAGLGIGSAIWYIVSNLIALFAGGWIAGRLTQARRPFDGMIHGLLTWSILTMATLYLLTSTIGSVLGGAGRLLGNTLSVAGNVAGKGIEAAAPAVGDKLKEEGINIDNLKQQAETLLRQTGKPALQPGALSNQATAATNTASNAASNVAANPQQSDNQLDGLLDNLKNRADGVTSQVDKDAMVNVIVARTGKSQAEASQIADNWIATYKQSAAKWEQTKKEAADKARDIA